MMADRMDALNLDERHALNMAEFSRALGEHRLWYLLPQGKNDIQDASGLFDRETGLIYPGVAALRAFLDQHPFAFIRTLDGKTLATLHSKTRLLWNNDASDNSYHLFNSRQVVQEGRWAGLEGWQLPSKDMFWVFATDSANPHRSGPEYWLATANGEVSVFWLTADGRCVTDKEGGCWGISVNKKSGRIFACHALWNGVSDEKMLADLVRRGWSLEAPGGAAFAPDARWHGLSDEAVFAACIAGGLYLRAHDNEDAIIDPQGFPVLHQLLDIDYRPCRLPRLDLAQLTDPEKG